MNPMTSTVCCRESVPGLFSGIETRIRSARSPSVKPTQFDINAPPVSGGVMSAPSRSRPWQLEHWSRKIARPRCACSSLYTPSHTVRGGSCAYVNSVRHSRTETGSRGNFEIGQILQLKSEIRDFRLDVRLRKSAVQFEISD